MVEDPVPTGINKKRLSWKEQPDLYL